MVADVVGVVGVACTGCGWHWLMWFVWLALADVVADVVQVPFDREEGGMEMQHEADPDMADPGI